MLVLMPVLVLVVMVLAPMSVHDACRARLRHNVATPLPGDVGCRASGEGGLCRSARHPCR